MTDFTKPVVTDLYTAIVPGINQAIKDLAMQLDPATSSALTNIPTGAIRWNNANLNWERYNGTAWLTINGNNTYSINISGIATFATNIKGAAWSIFYNSGTDTTAQLAAGAAGSVLQTNGAAAPTWVTQASLSVGTVTTTISSGAAATTQATTDSSTKVATTAFAVPRTGTTGSAVIPSGIQTARDASPIAGYLRFNTTLNVFEGYNGTAWGSIGGGATGGAGDTIFQLNKTVMTTSYTLPTGQNASLVGPLTINTGVVLTIPTGQRLVIL